MADLADIQTAEYIGDEFSAAESIQEQSDDDADFVEDGDDFSKAAIPQTKNVAKDRTTKTCGEAEGVNKRRKIDGVLDRLVATMQGQVKSDNICLDRIHNVVI
jgi:hypothetical protein